MTATVETATVELEPVTVCPLDRLQPERGAAALIGGEQVALFRLGDGSVHAIDHQDPATGANVLARGLVGTAVVDGELIWYVASPLLKHRYSLVDGRCLNDPRFSVRVHPVEVRNGEIRVTLATRSSC